MLGNDEPIASVVGEIVPGAEFYDYRAKYLDSGSQAIIPADIPPEVADERAAAGRRRPSRPWTRAGLARVDFFLERGTGRLYLNEINTMPGFTEISMYPKLWQASGVSFAELVARIAELALERFAERAQNETSSTHGRVSRASGRCWPAAARAARPRPCWRSPRRCGALARHSFCTSARATDPKARSPGAGPAVRGVAAGKLRRYWDPQNLTDPFACCAASARRIRWRRRFRPHVAFAAGGFGACRRSSPRDWSARARSSTSRTSSPAWPIDCWCLSRSASR